MKRYSARIITSLLALFIAFVIAVRVSVQKMDFDRGVRESLQTSEGYDQKFINMVKRLEEELVQRARFGYSGGKDPMTGKVRRVVQPRRLSKRKKTKQKSAPRVDPVKLTAIIFDDIETVFTAIVMDGERSYSVEVGDRIRDRRIVKITGEKLYMESDSLIYSYDIYGDNKIRKK